MGKMKWKSKEEIFENEKQDKKNTLSRECHEEIINGFTQTINGKKYHISYDMEAQTNFQETYQLFQNQVIDEIKWTGKFEGKPERLTFNKSQFETLFYNSVKHKQILISKLKDVMEPLVDSAETQEELDSIQWNDMTSEGLSFRLTKTLDRELGNLRMRTEMSDMALMEIANMVMGM